MYTTITSIAVDVNSVSISGTKMYNETLTANLNPSSANVHYQWYRADSVNGNYVAISNADDSTYLVGLSDIGKWIKVGVTGYNGYVGVVYDVTNGSISKRNAPSTPNAPSILSNLATEIEVDEVDSQEYSIDGGNTWQNSGRFSGLNPQSSYTVITRIKETPGQLPSSASQGNSLNTPAQYRVRFIGFDRSTPVLDTNVSSGLTPTAPSVSNTNTKRFFAWNINVSNVSSPVDAYAQFEEIIAPSSLNLNSNTFINKTPRYQTNAVDVRSSRLNVVETQKSQLITSEQTLINTFLEDEVEGETKYEYILDATLFVSYNSIEEQVTETSSPLTITFEVPEDFQNQDFKFIRIHNNVIEELQYSYNPQTHMIIFSTDRFSTYALLYGEDPNNTVSPSIISTTVSSNLELLPNTGVDQNYSEFILGLGLLLILVTKRRKRIKGS